MSKYEKRGLAKLKRSKKTWKNLLILFLVFFTFYLIFVVYNDMTESKNLMTYCYAFFVGNAIAANGMFSLGRSNVIIKKANDEIDKKIHFFGFYYLVAAIIGLFTCGIAYMYTNGTLTDFQSKTHTAIVFLMLSFFLTAGISFSFLATCNFLGFATFELLDNGSKD